MTTDFDLQADLVSEGTREAHNERGLCLDAVAAGMSHRQTTWRRPRLGGRRIMIFRNGLTLSEQG